MGLCRWGGYGGVFVGGLKAQHQLNIIPSYWVGDPDIGNYPFHIANFNLVYSPERATPNSVGRRESKPYDQGHTRL